MLFKAAAKRRVANRGAVSDGDRCGGAAHANAEDIPLGADQPGEPVRVRRIGGDRRHAESEPARHCVDELRLGDGSGLDGRER